MADGTVPSDNPVFDRARGPTSIWSYGHRDPQGLLFDSSEGLLYSTEHGPLGGDEFNLITAGENFGWPLFSYGLNYNGTPVSRMSEEEAGQSTVLPLHAWSRDFTVAPSGLERYRGDRFPSIAGQFLIGSLAQQRLLAYDPIADQTRILMNAVGRVRDVAELPSGDLLVALDAGSPYAGSPGRVIRVSPAD